MLPQQFGRGAGRALALALAMAGLAACERSNEMVAPEAAPQFTEEPTSGQQVTVRFFVVSNAPGFPAVEGAIISIYQDLTNTPLRLTTGADGKATIPFTLTEGTRLGYLVRVHPPIDFTLLTPGTEPALGTESPHNNLDAVTCGPNGQLTFAPQSLVDCIEQRYHVVTNNGTGIHDVVLGLPVVGNRPVVLRGLNGETLSSAEAFLIEEMPRTFPWQGNRPEGVTPGFLRFFDGGSNVLLPNRPANLEAKLEAANGITLAVSLNPSQLPMSGPIEAYLVPQICVNPAQPAIQTYAEFPPQDPKFSFTRAWWAYAANDGNGLTSALVKDLTTVAIIAEFSQQGGANSVEFSVRERTAGGTRTASATVNCTNGSCAISGVQYSMPGANNVIVPELSQPKPGKLILTVRNLDPTATVEWSAKASKGGVSAQIPIPDKSTNTSAFFPVSRDVTLCHPNYSFDKSFDINW